jgi:hypothetical protein
MQGKICALCSLNWHAFCIPPVDPASSLTNNQFVVIITSVALLIEIEFSSPNKHYLQNQMENGSFKILVLKKNS